MGKYLTYHELRRSEREGRDYRIHVRRGGSGIAVVAPHGGSIEPGTMEIADEVAGNEHVFYCFEGIKPKGNSDLHITSGNFDEPRGSDILRGTHLVLAVHGCKAVDKAVYIGGAHSDLKQRIRKELAYAGFEVKESLKPMAGRSPRNICNRGRAGAGIQLEISKGLRKQMLVYGAGHRDGIQKTDVFYKFVSALRKVLSQYKDT